jgi:hypothetical protein
MRKLFLFAAVITLGFIVKNLSANPLDVPYGIRSFGVGGSSVVLSTGSFASPEFGWCLEGVVISAPSAGTFTMHYTTATLTAGTTFYSAQLVANTALPLNWAYRTPVCAPPFSRLTLQSSVAGSTITYQGYSFKGWNP